MPSSDGPPSVSVVVATHGRARMLADLLDALEGQSRRDKEIIVVDDESPDDTPAVLAARGIRSVRVARGGPGLARQQGWQLARAPVIAFTDDDCVPTAGWLDALVAPIERGDADLVQGRTLPRPDQADRQGPWSRTQRVESENGFYQTCNMAYRREVLETLGGFRPSFAGPNTSGEDTELAWRAREAGYRTAFASEALVHHEVWPSSYWAYLRDRRRWGMVIQIVKYHPEIRVLAYRRWFYRPSHARLLLGLAVLAGSVIVRWWAPFALLGAFFTLDLVRTRDRAAPVHRRLLHRAQVLTADLVEVAVFAVNSIRYRTLYL
ncbi:MAG: glycosyltransferase [Actinomycetota bacterium]